ERIPAVLRRQPSSLAAQAHGPGERDGTFSVGDAPLTGLLPCGRHRPVGDLGNGAGSRITPCHLVNAGLRPASRDHVVAIVGEAIGSITGTLLRAERAGRVRAVAIDPGGTFIGSVPDVRIAALLDVAGAPGDNRR